MSLRSTMRMSRSDSLDPPASSSARHTGHERTARRPTLERLRLLIDLIAEDFYERKSSSRRSLLKRTRRDGRYISLMTFFQ